MCLYHLLCFFLKSSLALLDFLMHRNRLSVVSNPSNMDLYSQSFSNPSKFSSWSDRRLEWEGMCAWSSQSLRCSILLHLIMVERLSGL
ncbi:hypothetical protein SADUNF_Sadunf07G0048200 [Salix dunnii]|uniref:Secreted protein n=1 Tax=Salix dunnii TaxID=1413687 RepID=A0A835JZ22_9ROSI|nr:hypothetical protein SADUNF_Sadunf07G0048200 [Salix dunnii]